ncbi:polyprenyl synthetase family protein [Myxococcota bacterium]|nr:polyprenyl synthetase family protein [Myxococcota bacterium]MBU1533859.1 polyprenyl synthetase family protein [Myxococcota bacterium]
MQLPDCYPFFLGYIEEKLPSYLHHLPLEGSLREAANYSLMAPGKRIRPTMLLAMFASLTKRLTCCTCPTVADMEHIVPNPLHAACALEFIHTYSLIHDDLPAMDNDDFRRGRPALHRAMGEAMGILAGDALLTAAFLVVSRSYAHHHTLSAKISEVLSEAALAMVEGQVMDTIPSGDKPRSLQYLESLVDKKTGALITASLHIGGILADSREQVITHLLELGSHLGRLFQITDDILDVTGHSEQLGKTPGKDALLEKLTFVSLAGLDGARQLALETRDRALGSLTELDIDPRFFTALINFFHDRTY